MRSMAVALAVTLLLPVRAPAAKLPPPNKLALVQAQCGRCQCGADADCGTGGSCVGSVCVAGDGPRVSCRRAADCATDRPCATLAAHQCSASTTFTGGTALLLSARQPAPSCPKTGDPTENRSGEVILARVARAGAPFTGSLAAEVVFKTTFGTDPNATCPFVGQIETVSLTGTIACRAGRCRGTLYAFACLPKECADTPITSEFTSLVVYDDAGVALATPGVFLVPAAADAH